MWTSVVVNSLRGVGAARFKLPLRHHMMTLTSTNLILDRSTPGLTRAAPAVAHQGGGGKWTTDDQPNQPKQPNKIRGRENIVIGTWNVRTLRAAGKLEELTHEMERYRWNILGLCEIRWKGFGETLTREGHKLYYSGSDLKHEHGVGFLIHKDIVKLSWDADRFLADSSPFDCGHHPSTSPSSRPMPQHRTMTRMKWRTSMTNYKRS